MKILSRTKDSNLWLLSTILRGNRKLLLVTITILRETNRHERGSLLFTTDIGMAIGDLL